MLKDLMMKLNLLEAQNKYRKDTIAYIYKKNEL